MGFKYGYRTRQADGFKYGFRSRSGFKARSGWRLDAAGFRV